MFWPFAGILVLLASLNHFYLLLFAEVGKIIIDFVSYWLCIYLFINKGVTTLTEEEKNAQAQADKENEEENDDFKVVMPEANKTTMPQEEFKEQPDYLKVFANFYIAEFDEDDLEIINLYDENHNMVDINRYILNNVHFPRKKLVDHVLQYHDYNFKNLLKIMEEKTGVKPEEMLTYEAWEKWDEDQRAKLHSSLS